MRSTYALTFNTNRSHHRLILLGTWSMPLVKQDGSVLLEYPPHRSGFVDFISASTVNRERGF